MDGRPNRGHKTSRFGFAALSPCSGTSLPFCMGVGVHATLHRNGRSLCAYPVLAASKNFCSACVWITAWDSKERPHPSASQL